MMYIKHALKDVTSCKEHFHIFLRVFEFDIKRSCLKIVEASYNSDYEYQSLTLSRTMTAVKLCGVLAEYAVNFCSGLFFTTETKALNITQHKIYQLN